MSILKTNLWWHLLQRLKSTESAGSVIMVRCSQIIAQHALQPDLHPRPGRLRRRRPQGRTADYECDEGFQQGAQGDDERCQDKDIDMLQGVAYEWCWARMT